MTDQKPAFYEGGLGKIIDTMTDPLFVKDRKHRWVVINEAFAKLMGRPKAELLGKSDYEFLPKDQADIFWEKDELVFASGQENINEEKITGADGVERWIITKKTPFTAENGEQFIVAIIRDITDTKNAQEKLWDSERLLSTMFTSLNDGVMVFGLKDRKIISCNRAMEKIFGYSILDLIGADTRKIHINDEAFQAFGAQVKSDCAHGQNFNKEYLLCRKNGEEFAAEIFVQPIVMADGKMEIAVEVIHDISKRKKAEEAQGLLSQVVEQVAESVVITDVDGKILYVNPAFERVSGYRREELMGQNPRIVRSGKHDQKFYADMWSTILRGETWRGRLTNRRKDGAIFEEESIISPIRDNTGRITRFVAIKRDITLQIEMENQLMQAQKMEAVGRLAGGVAHDFNNLLTSILGFAQMVSDQVDPKLPVAEDVKEIIRAGDRAASLTQQLLTFSRKQIIEPHMMDLNATVREMEGMLKRTIGEDVRLNIRESSEVWHVKMDPTQVGQILVNLVVNARDAMPKGGTLAVDLKNERVEEKLAYRREIIRPGNYTVLSVSDTGSGMTEEVQEHLFEPFFTTKPKGKGTGLGLATVYGIVKQNNGHITVYSEPGNGTTIRVYFPRQEDSAINNATSKADPDKLSGFETILLVEDEPMVRVMAQRSLQSQGYRVLTCESGSMALDVLQKEAGVIHLLLTDVVMPEMSGPVLAEKVQNIKPGIKVVFMSGYTNEMIAAHGVLEEGTQFIQKPFTPAGLAKKIRDVLG